MNTNGEWLRIISETAKKVGEAEFYNRLMRSEHISTLAKAEIATWWMNNEYTQDAHMNGGSNANYSLKH